MTALSILTGHASDGHAGGDGLLEAARTNRRIVHDCRVGQHDVPIGGRDFESQPSGQLGMTGRPAGLGHNTWKVGIFSWSSRPGCPVVRELYVIQDVAALNDLNAQHAQSLIAVAPSPILRARDELYCF